MDSIKQPKTPAERARAYRERKKQSEPLTKEQRIAIIERQISDPDISPRDLKSLSRELSLLKGESLPYDRRPVIERKPIEPPTDELPTWMNEFWQSIYLEESRRGCSRNFWTERLVRKYSAMSPEEKAEFQAKAEAQGEEWARRHGQPSAAPNSEIQI